MDSIGSQLKEFLMERALAYSVGLMVELGEEFDEKIIPILISINNDEEP